MNGGACPAGEAESCCCSRFHHGRSQHLTSLHAGAGWRSAKRQLYGRGKYPSRSACVTHVRAHAILHACAVLPPSSVAWAIRHNPALRTRGRAGQSAHYPSLSMQDRSAPAICRQSYPDHPRRLRQAERKLFAPKAAPRITTRSTPAAPRALRPRLGCDVTSDVPLRPRLFRAAQAPPARVMSGERIEPESSRTCDGHGT